MESQLDPDDSSSEKFQVWSECPEEVNFKELPLTRVIFFSDEMIETENQSLRDRVADLEKKVHDQNDEIMCLRSTLADALRRITSLEENKRKRIFFVA